MRQPWTGQDILRQNALPIRPNKPYWLMHHPITCWQFVNHRNRWLFLPTFRRLLEMAGVNGVRMVRNGTDSGMARLRMQDNGFQILDLEMGYQQRFPTKNGGHYYASTWTFPKVIGNRVIWKEDTEQYNDWRESLLTDGILDYPDEDALEMLVEVQEKRVLRNEGKTHIPAIKTRYDNDLKILKFMKEYIRTKKPVLEKKPKRKEVKKSV